MYLFVCVCVCVIVYETIRFLGHNVTVRRCKSPMLRRTTLMFGFVISCDSK